MNCPHCKKHINIGALMGGVSTPAKAAAARRNGKKGGRPKKIKWMSGLFAGVKCERCGRDAERVIGHEALCSQCIAIAKVCPDLTEAQWLKIQDDIAQGLRRQKKVQN